MIIPTSITPPHQLFTLKPSSTAPINGGHGRIPSGGLGTPTRANQTTPPTPDPLAYATGRYVNCDLHPLSCEIDGSIVGAVALVRTEYVESEKFHQEVTPQFHGWGKCTSERKGHCYFDIKCKVVAMTAEWPLQRTLNATRLSGDRIFIQIQFKLALAFRRSGQDFHGLHGFIPSSREHHVIDAAVASLLKMGCREMAGKQSASMAVNDLHVL
ncbi:hypothetical protein DFH07DRAFT_770554 [Mycena maculata]|uniref:Uncharacterized protein n=1 Tax=Mycena maculata TaxID=230809 RepID=A0AAD7JHR2_9AGAR|nr:hypothetical protein DFH07DRAFT_770554 [Mycena maculata]